MKKGIQYFSDEYLERCRQMTPEAIVDFLEDFRKMLSTSDQTTQINTAVPDDLLDTFSKSAQKANMTATRNKRK